MSYKQGEGWLIKPVLVALLGGIVCSATAYAQPIPIAIPITGGIPSEWGWCTYSTDFTVHLQSTRYRLETIALSADIHGRGAIWVNTSLEVKVVHPNGTTGGRVIYSGGIPVSPDITPLFAKGKNKVFITLFGACPLIRLSSSPIWLIRRVTFTSGIYQHHPALGIIRMTIGEIDQLKQEMAEMRSSWNIPAISRELDLAMRYARRCPRHDRLCRIAQTFIDKAIERLDNVNLIDLVDHAREGLPELRGEIEAVTRSKESVERRGKEVVEEIDNLYMFLTTWPWHEIRWQIGQIMDILSVARGLLDPPYPLSPDEAMQVTRLLKEAGSLLPLPIGEIEQINSRLTEIRGKIRSMQGGARGQNLFSFELHPNPITSGLPAEVAVNGIDVESIELRLLALDGKLVLDRRVEGGWLQFHPLDDKGRSLANGVYLYVITVRGRDGSVIKSTVRKLVVMH